MCLFGHPRSRVRNMHAAGQQPRPMANGALHLLWQGLFWWWWWWWWWGGLGLVCTHTVRLHAHEDHSRQASVCQHGARAHTRTHSEHKHTGGHTRVRACSRAEVRAHGESTAHTSNINTSTSSTLCARHLPTHGARVPRHTKTPPPRNRYPKQASHWHGASAPAHARTALLRHRPLRKGNGSVRLDTKGGHAVDAPYVRVPVRAEDMPAAARAQVCASVCA